MSMIHLSGPDDDALSSVVASSSQAYTEGFAASTIEWDPAHVANQGYNHSVAQSMHWQEIPQQPYGSGSRKRLGQVIDLTPVAQYGATYRLDRAVSGVFVGTVDHNELAFPNITMAQKMSIRYQFVGHTTYSRQASVLRSTKGNGRVEQPTKGFLATIAARELVRFIEIENAQGTSPFPYRLDQLILLDIRLVSDGSLQPSVGVILPRP